MLSEEMKVNSLLIQGNADVKGVWQADCSITSISASLDNEQFKGSEMLQKTRELLKHHNYVSVELPDSCLGGDGALLTLHLTRSKEEEGRINVHLVSDKFNPQGGRYTSLEQRSFLNTNGAQVEDNRLEDLTVIAAIREAYNVVQKRYTMPHLVQMERQGYYERGSRVVLALKDTGGETKYVDEQAKSAAKMGFVVTVVNQGGPIHPKNLDVREGMHYKRDFVDVLYVVEDRTFVRKEDTFPEYDFESVKKDSRPEITKLGLYQSLAVETDKALSDRPITHVLGHYICGASVAYELFKLREFSYLPIPTLPGFVAHSLGAVKRDRLRKENPDELVGLNLERRIETERRLLQTNRIRPWAVSKEIADSLEQYYATPAQGFFPAGVDPSVFYPRPNGVTKSDSRYHSLWQKLALAQRQIQGRPLCNEHGEIVENPSELKPKDLYKLLKGDIKKMQSATIVTESSRTVSTKGKDGTLKAFAEACRLAPEANLLLITNFSDKENLSARELAELSAAELKEHQHINDLHALVDELGIRDKIIFFPSIPNEEVALLGQVADIYHTDASMETWGMSLQQAGCCELILICSDQVPIGTEVLAGKRALEKSIELANGSYYNMTEGCIITRQGDYQAAGAAIARIVTDKSIEFKKQIELMRRFGHIKANSSTWDSSTMGLLEQSGIGFKRDGAGFIFKDTKHPVF